LRETIKQIANPIVAPQMSTKTSLDTSVRDGMKD
jgi:hypothetical protein